MFKAKILAYCPCIISACIIFFQEQCGSYTFIPYVVSPQGKVFACDASMMTGIKELMQPSFQLEPLLTLLVERLVHLLNNVHIQSRSDINCFAKHIIISDFTHTCSCCISQLVPITKLKVWDFMIPLLFMPTASTSGSRSGMRFAWHGSGSAAKT